MRFEALYERRHRRDLTMAEAAEMLGVTERTFRRWSDRYEATGIEGFAGPMTHSPIWAGGAGR